MIGIKKCIYYTLGFSTTAPLLAVVVGGHYISLMYFVYIIIFADLFFSGGKYTINIKNNSNLFKNFLLYLFLCFIASLIGMVFFWNDEKAYSMAQIRFIPQILIYLILLFLLDRNNQRDSKVNYILNGIKYGALINIIWSIVDAFVFYTIGLSITNVLFVDVIEAMGVPHAQASTIEGLFIRSAGLTIDQCFIGYYAIALTVYGLVRNKKWLILLSVIACFASVTIIGLVGILIVLFGYIITHKNVVPNVALLSFIAVFIVMAYYFSDNEMISNFKTAVQLRIESKADNDASASTRLLFIEEFPGALMNLPTALFLGTGYFSASYAYFQQGLEYGKYNRFHMYPVPIENMYIETLFAVGLVGLIFFVLFYYKIIKKTDRIIKLQKSDSSIFILNSFIIGAVILFLFYHNVFDSTIMLLSICAAVILKDRRTLSTTNKQKR